MENITASEFKELISDSLTRYFASNLNTASAEQLYKATAITLRDILLRKKQRSNSEVVKNGLKRVYYLCMEFLLGRSLKNNLYNLGLTSLLEETLKSTKYTIDDLYETESDAGLGNGGLGRLAACYMDALSTLNYPAMGFSLRYEYGLFKQKIIENNQVELPDEWLSTGEVWLMARSDKYFTVRLGGSVKVESENGKLKFTHTGGQLLEAIAFDYMVSGYDSKNVNVIRLWRAVAKKQFDMQSFSQGDYLSALAAQNEAELISKVLYPSDEHYEGKQLRLSQQYFLVSASLQSIISDHLRIYPDLSNLPDKAAIHINDTHPALAIPELMRLLMDEHGFSWDDAWKITVKTIAYTNHTVLCEALEKWDLKLFKALLPRIYMIIDEINRRFQNEMQGSLPFEKLANMLPLYDNTVRMANLCVLGSHSVNGVSTLHSQILKERLFPEFDRISPEKFCSVTNGIAYRRWLCQANPKLSELLKQLIGDGFLRDASELGKLRKYENDATVLRRLHEVKRANKVSFSNYISDKTGVSINPDSRFDVQIKRLHEYKRQLINALKIISLYIKVKDGDLSITPQTFIFGAKAAGGYYHAKRVIKLINCLSQTIAADKKARDIIRVLFVENYDVTKAERIIPAAEVSEQISLAGKEASGTSNMKFMLNGALTLGTVDGANVEIKEAVGDDNIFTFGMSAEDVDETWKKGYSASSFYTHDAEIRATIDMLRAGFGGESFADLAGYLTIGSGNIADPYMCLKDFSDYVKAAAKLDESYKDIEKWNKKSLINIAESGVFSAERSIEQYARNIWHLKKTK